MLTITTSHPNHHYTRCLYDCLSDEIVELRPQSHAYQEAEILQLAMKCDVFHLHWPENLFDGDCSKALDFVLNIKSKGKRIVWTLHNAQPHRTLKGGGALYQAVAAVTDAAIHHSVWGKQKVTSLLDFNPECQHAVINHGHFGPIVPDDVLNGRPIVRAATEQKYELYPTGIRLGIIGAPRNGKVSDQFISAFKAVRRDDLGLFSTSEDPSQLKDHSDDRRIASLPYSFVDREVFYHRLSSIDLLILPFSPNTQMLTTGVIADAIALGIPCARTSWGFLAELLGENAIFMGDTFEENKKFIEGLNAETIEQYRRKIVGIKPKFEWQNIARDTLELLKGINIPMIETS